MFSERNKNQSLCCRPLPSLGAKFFGNHSRVNGFLDLFHIVQPLYLHINKLNAEFHPLGLGLLLDSPYKLFSSHGDFTQKSLFMNLVYSYFKSVQFPVDPSDGLDQVVGGDEISDRCTDVIIQHGPYFILNSSLIFPLPFKTSCRAFFSSFML